MKITVIAPSELDGGLRAAWRALQASDSALASPYFCPELTLAVAAIRDDVRVAVLEDAGRVAGFFPHERDAAGVCRPVGGVLSDHHGVVAAPDTRWDWRELFEAAGIAQWRFDHLVPAQAPPSTVALRLSESPALDLKAGYAAYRASRERAGSRQMQELDRKARKLAREVGPVRFEAHTCDVRVLKRILALKSAQCLTSGVFDCFSVGWTRALVERVAHAQAETFAGAVSALYAGDALVAAHLGMRSDRVWHWWFPVYDRAYARYSPGALLLLRVAEAAAESGATMLDLGKGNDAYKERFADLHPSVAEGFLSTPSLMNTTRGARVRIGTWLRHAPLLAPLRPAVRVLRRLAPGAP